MEHGKPTSTFEQPMLRRELDQRAVKVRGQLSANDERVLAFTYAHLGDLAFYTAESLAQGAAVSPAAVVRFARRLGFANFRELRDRARQELQATPEVREGHNTALAEKVQRDVANLQILPSLLEAPLADAVGTIGSARATWFVGNRETYGLATYAHRLLHHVTPSVHLVDPGFPDPLRSIGPADAVVAITFRPYARQTLDLLAGARAAGARIVVVTDGQGHSFLEPSDVILAVPVESPTLVLSFVAAVCALEALAAGVARLDADRTHDTLEQTAAFIELHGLESTPRSSRA
jgi:DNA-binding MurR/RpiR family transcriptional regulator